MRGIEDDLLKEVTIKGKTIQKEPNDCQNFILDASGQ
jgi:hypothetical protein